jgi:hypothetical protein
MKSLYLVKLFLAISLGVLAGQAVTRDYAKWHSLGRDAFLAAQGNRFDKYMAHPAPGGIHVILGAIFVVSLLAAYEIASFWGAKCVTLIAGTIRER